MAMATALMARAIAMAQATISTTMAMATALMARATAMTQATISTTMAMATALMARATAMTQATASAATLWKQQLSSLLCQTRRHPALPISSSLSTQENDLTNSKF